MVARYASFVDGKPALESDDYLRPRDPATGDEYAEVAVATAAGVDEAVRSAHRAYQGWKRLAPVERGRILHRVSQAILANVEELARLETQAIGQPLSVSRIDATAAARYFEFFAGAVDKFQGEVIPMGENYHVYSVREPFGVIGHILPWNAPLQQSARGVAPSLAVGNTVVVKPASDTPLSILALARVASEAGLPDGVFNVVSGRGSSTGMAIVDHPLVRKIAFTGSVETGTLLMKRAAERVLPMSMELGGKSPNIIFDDADFDAAIEGSWRAFTTKCGQICSSGTRLLVQDTVYDEIVDRLVARAGAATIGPGIDDPEIGPLTNRSQYDQVLDYIRIGKDEGAAAVVGGGPIDDPRLAGGNFVRPTIFTGVTNDMRIAREEIFGPVLSVIRFHDEDEAVRIANDTEFGLAAGVWTTDLGRAIRVARQIEAGQVFVNEYFTGGVETPFGGFKYSGFGREKGLESMKTYSATKSTIIRL